MNIKGFIGLSLCVGAMLLSSRCDDPANPFANTENAKAAVYTKTFNDLDTISIFSSETLAIVAYLKEHLQEVAVHIDNNRLWPSSSDSILELDNYNGDPVRIPFSFYDTGWQKIEIRSLQNSGKFFKEQYSLYARSPLYQKTLRGNVGDTIQLKTVPVGDAQVLYVWDFHDGTVIKEYTNEIPLILKRMFTSTIGELYVTDPKFTSPSVPFSIDTSTAATMELVCMNDSVYADTAYTNQATFTFKVLVTGTEHLKNASVNGTPFNDIKLLNGSILLSKIYNGLDVLDEPMKAEVVVTNGKGASVTSTFFIQYDNTVTIEAPRIVLTAPATINDTVYVMQPHVKLQGSIAGTISVEQLFLQLIINGKLTSIQKIVPDSADWTFPVQLTNGWHSLLLQLSEDSLLTGSVITAKAVHLNLNPYDKDTIAPKINSIKIDNVLAGSEQIIISRNKNVTISVLASDNKQVAWVTINGEKAKVGTDGLTFNDTVTLVHTKEGKQYLVSAGDSAGNKTSDTLTARYNSIPKILDMSLPTIMNIDSAYIFTVHASDSDSDAILSTITLKGTKTDTILTLVNSTARWTPALKDTGALRLQVHVSDPFFESADTLQTAYVMASKTQTPPVSLKTVADDFPDSLIVGGKSLSLPLRAKTFTGTPPLSFSVYLKNPLRKLYSGGGTSFSWSPTRADIGVQTLQIIVSDKVGFADTLEVLITVVASPAASVWLTESALSVTEGGNDLTVGVRLSAPLSDTVRIPYKIVFGSADFADIKMDSTGVVKFKPGDTLVNMPIKILDDTKAESDEIFTIVLPPLPQASGKDSLIVDKKKSELLVTLQDNDNTISKVGVMLQPDVIPNPVPEVAFLGEFPAIVLTSALPFDLTVKIKPTAAITATAGSDYTIVGESIVIKAGETVGSLKLLLIDDRTHENTEIIEYEIVEISNTSAASISVPSVSRVYVSDND